MKVGEPWLNVLSHMLHCWQSVPVEAAFLSSVGCGSCGGALPSTGGQSDDTMLDDTSATTRLHLAYLEASPRVEARKPR